MKWLTLTLIFSPETQFLSKSAVVRFVSCSERQPQFFGCCAQMSNYSSNFFRTCPEEIFQELPILRCFRMEGKGPPADSNIIFFLQFFNTPGNEIAVGSDIVRKDFQFHLRFHPLARIRGVLE
jgi:hypothetical protein